MQARQWIADGIRRGAWSGLWVGTILWLGLDVAQVRSDVITAVVILVAWILIGVVVVSLAYRWAGSPPLEPAWTFGPPVHARWTWLGVESGFIGVLQVTWQYWTASDISVSVRVVVPMVAFLLPCLLGIALDLRRWRRDHPLEASDGPAAP
jgi:hypothetical protein